MTYEHGPRAPRLPAHLRRPLAREGRYRAVRELLEGSELNTVCQSARCPNNGECFAKGTATFLIGGDRCTRSCRFCAVTSAAPAPLDPAEPDRVARAAEALGLSYVVITMVTRDDLDDGAASHVAATVEAVRRRIPVARIEVLTSDFGGKRAAIDRVIEAEPDVFNHNVETVPRLYPTVRPEADYERSLEVLRHVKGRRPSMPTKSGLMLGLGETDDEVVAVMRDLRAAGCDAITLGQYLRPSAAHLPVAAFVTPETFESFECGA